MLLGALVVPGVALVVGGVPVSMHAGIAVGTLSALLVALFGALNKKYVEHAEPLTMTFVELGAGGAFLWLVGGAWALAHGGFDAAQVHFAGVFQVAEFFQSLAGVIVSGGVIGVGGQ